jgi:hypothetical protein
MNDDGSEVTNLTRTGRIDEYDPDWSPDAQKITFTRATFSRTRGERGDIFVMKADGTDTRAFEYEPAWQPTDGSLAATGTLQPQRITTYHYGDFVLTDEPALRSAGERCGPERPRRAAPHRERYARARLRERPGRGRPPATGRHPGGPAVGRTGGIWSASMRICRRWSRPVRPAFPNSGARRSCAVRCSSTTSARPPAA